LNHFLKTYDDSFSTKHVCATLFACIEPAAAFWHVCFLPWSHQKILASKINLGDNESSWLLSKALHSQLPFSMGFNEKERAVL